MIPDIKDALNEIMEISPLYRRDYIIDYLRKYLPKDEARRYLFEKRKVDFWRIMMAQGFFDPEEFLEQLGLEKVRFYFHSTGKRS